MHLPRLPGIQLGRHGQHAEVGCSLHEAIMGHTTRGSASRPSSTCVQSCMALYELIPKLAYACAFASQCGWGCSRQPLSWRA